MLTALVCHTCIALDAAVCGLLIHILHVVKSVSVFVPFCMLGTPCIQYSVQNWLN